MLITFFNKTTKNIFNTKHVKKQNYKPPLTIIDKKEYIFLKD